MSPELRRQLMQYRNDLSKRITAIGIVLEEEQKPLDPMPATPLDILSLREREDTDGD